MENRQGSDNPQRERTEIMSEDTKAAPRPTEPDSGLYVLWLHLPEAVHVDIGALGPHRVEAGLFGYVGSARRGREARIARHLQREKRRHWHIDYLRPAGDIVAVTRIDEPNWRECELVEHLIQRLGGNRVIPRFGASDCRCGGHLVAAATRDFGPIAAQIDRATGGATAPAELWRS